MACVIGAVQPLASVVMMAPRTSRQRSSAGMPGISPPAPSTTACASKSCCSAAQTCSRCSAVPLPARSTAPRSVLPSIATTWPARSSVNARTQLRNVRSNSTGSSALNTRRNVSGAGRAVGQIEERAEPVGARLGEVFEGVPAVGATQRAAQGHHDDVVERVELGAIDARVVEDREVGQHETHAVRRSDDGFRAWATCHRGDDHGGATMSIGHEKRSSSARLRCARPAWCSRRIYC
jgi:hypothetical protein